MKSSIGNDFGIKPLISEVNVSLKEPAISLKIIIVTSIFSCGLIIPSLGLHTIAIPRSLTK